MARPKTIHIIPNSTGDWVVRAPSSRASRVFSTQAEALKAAQASVRDVGGQLHVHEVSGQLKTSFTLGRAAMDKLNAIEGVSLTPVGKAAFKTFDREDLTPTQRRAALRAKIAEMTGRPKKKSTGVPGATTKG